MIDDSDDGLAEGDLVPDDGGTWGGLLFDNPSIGLAPLFTWSFGFPFKEVTRSYGASPVRLDIEWLALAVPSWRTMAGQAVAKAAEPAEASVYFFMHHQYDGIAVEILEQRDALIRCRATLSGDLDGLGIDPIAADAWLRFDGITVYLSSVDSPDAALTRLQDFTDIDGLVHSQSNVSGTFRFLPPTPNS